MSAAAATANEEILVIETPERVPLHFALASIGNRFLACAADHSIQVILMLMVVAVLQWVGLLSEFKDKMSEAPKWAIAAVILAWFLIWSGYFAVFEWLWHGQTPGKRALRLRVIREDGRPVTFWEAAARNLVRIFDMMPFPFYSVGLLSVFLSSRDQRVGDFVAATVVVREREAEAPTFDSVFGAPTSDVAMRRAFKPVVFTGDTSSMTEREIEVVETFLRRRWDFSDGVRQWMAWRVSMPILYKLRPDFDRDSFTYEGFLEELLQRYRAEHRL
ncbi:MAG: RDD family protein [Acidobacteria bacterium]|nr:RDD family protein [Acidobacteriota bacterium]MCA1642414.1 RDD family protein [Acidobacteriota bacterium]